MYYCVLMRVCCWVTYSHESCCCRQQNKANRCGFKEIFEERQKKFIFIGGMLLITSIWENEQQTFV